MQKITIEVPLTTLRKKIVHDFIDFVNKELNIKEPPEIIIQNDKQGIQTTACYNFKDNVIKVYGKDRKLVDILRSAGHEMAHAQQRESGELERVLKANGKVADIGGTAENDHIEDEANAVAGRLIKKFAKEKTGMIYEQEEPKNEIPGGSKEVNPERLARDIVRYFQRKGNVNVSILKDYFSIDKLLSNIVNDKYKNVDAFFNYFKEYLIEYLKTCDYSYIMIIDIRELYRFFDAYHNAESSESLFTVLHQLSGGGIDIFSTYIEIPTDWDQFIFNKINKQNISLLQRYTKTKAIDDDFLQEEYPDLCKMFCFSYTRAYEADQNAKLQQRIMNKVEDFFSNFDPQWDLENGNLEIRLTFEQLFKSESYTKEFNDQLISDIEDVLSHRSKNEVHLKFTHMENIIMFPIINLVDRNYEDESSKIFEEIHGSFIAMNLDYYLNYGLGSGIDVQFFNELIHDQIIGFFERK